MSSLEGSGGSSSPDSAALGDVLSFFGSVADHAAGAAPNQGRRIAALAVQMGELAGLARPECDALYYAALLRNAGTLGNAAFVKGDDISQRAATAARWDIPAEGARICKRIECLPDATPDIVRWQAECWDGTGYPDQLRWTGIPPAAQLLHIAQCFADTPEPDDGLATISGESGRTFSPEQTRTFATWYHTSGGEIREVEAPVLALNTDRATPMGVLATLSEAVDRHNGTPGRAERVARFADGIARVLALGQNDRQNIARACLVYGIGELRAAAVESSQFDALARLGIETRAAHAVRAASLAAASTFLAQLPPVLRARAEWYDGTGAPDGLRHDEIPMGASILAVAIAYDAIEESFRSRIAQERVSPMARIETAAGTQFAPECVRALAEALKTRA